MALIAAEPSGWGRLSAKSRSMQPLQILIADSHEAVRRWVRAALEAQEGWTVCGDATTAAETVARTIELTPDVVLLDAGLQGLSDVDVAQEIVRIAPALHVLTLTTFTAGHARRQDEESARGELPTTETGQTLVDAIKALVDRRRIAGAQRPASDERRSDAGAAARERQRKEISAALTVREREVLRHLADGKSNKEVGVMLRISTRTVETHRARLMRKLDLHSISQLVRYAIRHRIINA
jgi:DNA-binding NarL/FixJ family response regulator